MGKTALITGASGEIGAATALQLAHDGFDICACYFENEKRANELVGEIKSLERGSAAVRLDLTSANSIEQAHSGCCEALGEPAVLVNCAGCESVGLFTDLTDEELERVFEVNLLGAMRLTRTVIKSMLRQHGGYVVNVASVWGEVGASCETAYSAAKAGLIGFTKSLAKECAPSGVRINCVSPGFIDTKMNAFLSKDERADLIEQIPLRRAGTTQDVANAVSFLVSGKADYICGQVLRVDGLWID
ncbi:MAG: 3-oxoacyl-ACP reductase FabG [Ruminococcus sp.]|nr:3-oxoacyl-ACP reductase FabG [Ruminococcus sp.]